jgi:hypothetical protein
VERTNTCSNAVYSTYASSSRCPGCCPNRLFQAYISELISFPRILLGSGKTGAYLLPILSKVSEVSKASRRGIQALLLAPTRELAEQIHREAVRLSTGKRLKICVLKKNVASNALQNQVITIFFLFHRELI